MNEPVESLTELCDNEEEYEAGELDLVSPRRENLLSNDLGLRIQEREEGALEELMARSTPLLRGVVFKILRSEQDTEDVLTNVFTSLWNSPDGFDPAKGLYTGWVITIARRRAIDFLRRRESYDAAKARYFAKKPRTSSKSPRRFTPIFINDDVYRMLHELLADEKIPAAQRNALNLHYVRGLSHRDIARLTGIPLSTIRTQLELGLKKLKSAAFADQRFKDQFA